MFTALLSTVDWMLLAQAFWGFCGAFVYAGPRYVMCRRVCRAEGENTRGCAEEMVVSCLIGAIAGFSLGQYAADMVNQTQPHQVRAVTVIVGLVANRAAPGLIRLFSTKDGITGILQTALKALGGKA